MVSNTMQSTKPKQKSNPKAVLSDQQIFVEKGGKQNKIEQNNSDPTSK